MNIDAYKDGREMTIFHNDISNGIFRSRLIDALGPVADPSRALISYLAYIRRGFDSKVTPLQTITIDELVKMSEMDKKVILELESIVNEFEPKRVHLSVEDVIAFAFRLNLFADNPSSNYANLFMVDHFGKYPFDWMNVEELIREGKHKPLEIALGHLIDDMTENMYQMDGARIYINNKPRIRYVRGENDVYPFSKPSIYRPRDGEEVDDVDIALDEIRIQEFGKEIQRIPAIAKWASFGDIEIDSIAQHYGMRTHMLDFSSDIDVALFFACTIWDKEKNGFRPMTKEETQEGTDKQRKGVIYVLPYSVERDLSDVQRRQYITKIGKQPFLRPTLQSGYLLSMGKSESLQTNPYFQRYCFDITEELSNKIFKKMEDGEKIYPHEPFEELSNLASRISGSNEIDINCTKKYLARNGITGDAEEAFYSKAMAKGIVFGKPTFLDEKAIKDINDKTEKFNEGLPKELKELMELRIKAKARPMFAL